MPVDGQGLANNYDQFKFQKYLCHAQIKIRDSEFCDITLASVGGQKFKAQKIILSSSITFFKKLLVNNLNHHPI